MISDKLANSLGANLAPDEAGALAVFASHIRRRINERVRQVQSEENKVEENPSDLINFLEQLERAAIDSISCNDGDVVYWIGVAAKQMNPLLS